MALFTLKKLTLATTIALSSVALVACGGGSDNKSSNTVNTDVTKNAGLSELDQAKELVRAAKLFVSDMDAVQGVYENATDILNAQQRERVSTSLGLIFDIHDYMRDNNLTNLSATDIDKLNQSLSDDFLDMKLTPKNGFSAIISGDDVLTVKGALELAVTDYNVSYKQVNGNWQLVRQAHDNDSYDISYTNAVDNTTSSASSKNIDLSVGFDKIVIGSGASAVTFTGKQDSLTAKGTMNKAVVADDDFNFDDAKKKDILIEKGTLALQNIKMMANNNVINASKLELSVLDISNKVNGKTLAKTVPYSIVAMGNLVKGEPEADLNFTLNLMAKDSDVRQLLEVTADDSISEKSGKILPITAMLSVKGDVTKEAGTVIPLDFQASLERDSNENIILKNLVAGVEGKMLNITGKVNMTDGELVSSQFTIKQNNAKVVIKTDAEGDVVSTNNGKVADVMVNGKDYGDIFDTGSMITAKFTDNSTITF